MLLAPRQGTQGCCPTHCQSTLVLPHAELAASSGSGACVFQSTDIVQGGEGADLVETTEAGGTMRKGNHAVQELGVGQSAMWKRCG